MYTKQVAMKLKAIYQSFPPKKVGAADTLHHYQSSKTQLKNWVPEDGENNPKMQRVSRDDPLNVRKETPNTCALDALFLPTWTGNKISRPMLDKAPVFPPPIDRAARNDEMSPGAYPYATWVPSSGGGLGHGNSPTLAETEEGEPQLGRNTPLRR